MAEHYKWTEEEMQTVKYIRLAEGCKPKYFDGLTYGKEYEVLGYNIEHGVDCFNFINDYGDSVDWGTWRFEPVKELEKKTHEKEVVVFSSYEFSPLFDLMMYVNSQSHDEMKKSIDARNYELLYHFDRIRQLSQDTIDLMKKTSLYKRKFLWRWNYA